MEEKGLKIKIRVNSLENFIAVLYFIAGNTSHNLKLAIFWYVLAGVYGVIGIIKMFTKED